MPYIDIKINKDNLKIELDAVGYPDLRCVVDLEVLNNVLNAITITEQIKAEALYNTGYNEGRQK